MHLSLPLPLAPRQKDDTTPPPDGHIAFSDGSTFSDGSGFAPPNSPGENI